MYKISAAIALISIMSAALLWWLAAPTPLVHPNIDTSYQSIAYLETETMVCSGVLLKSGYVLTASHCIDRNHNGIVDDDEKFMEVGFTDNNGVTFITTATVVAINYLQRFGDLDLAVLKLEEQPPIEGVELLTTDEYNQLMIGTEVLIMGMTNGEKPANITKGLITAMDDPHNHRSSAAVYLGNSGGGVFIVNKKLIGIMSKVGVDQALLRLPIFNGETISGSFRISYTRYLSNVSRYVPAPAIRAFIENEGLSDQVFPVSFWFKPEFQYFLLVVLANLTMVLGVFRVTYWLENKN